MSRESSREESMMSDDRESPPPSAAVAQMVGGGMVAQVVRTMVVLGLPECLGDQPRTSAELARLTGTHEPALARLLQALVALGLCTVDEEQHIALTSRGETLRSNSPDSMAATTLLLAAPWLQQIWEHLPDAVRTGGAVSAHAHGVGFWEYLAAHPEDEQLFDAGMTEGAIERGQALLAAHDLSSVGILVDVGGGQGRLLSEVLRTVPALRGHLVDRPEVVAGASDLLQRAGVADRCTVTGCDFLDSVPGGGDAYVLAQILHDWSDQEALSILRVCREAMKAGVRLWIIERVLPTGDVGPGDALRNLNMLVLVGGQERTAEEYRALLERAGFGRVMIQATELGWDVIEAVRL
jgi:hypothetical protein